MLKIICAKNLCCVNFHSLYNMDKQYYLGRCGQGTRRLHVVVTFNFGQFTIVTCLPKHSYVWWLIGNHCHNGGCCYDNKNLWQEFYLSWHIITIVSMNSRLKPQFQCNKSGRVQEAVTMILSLANYRNSLMIDSQCYSAVTECAGTCDNYLCWLM